MRIIVMKNRLMLLALLLLPCTSRLVAQTKPIPQTPQLRTTATVLAPRWAVKTNLLYDATTTINLGFELGIGRKWTLDVSGNYNPWTFADNKKLKHWLVQPEFRYWNCERFNRGFWGFHLLGGQYNVGNFDLPAGIFPSLADYRYEGRMVGAGISYGWQWYLGAHWNLEATVGFGYIYSQYDKFPCPKCGIKESNGEKHYFGPTKVGVSLIYLFKTKRK